MGGGRRGSDRARRRHVRRKKGMRDVIGRRARLSGIFPQIATARGDIYCVGPAVISLQSIHAA